MGQGELSGEAEPRPGGRGQGVIERLPRAKRNLVLVLVLAAGLWFLWTVREVVNPLILGYLFAFVLHPWVEALVRRGLSRRMAVSAIFLAGLLLAVGVGFGLFVQGRSLVRDVGESPDLRERIEERLEQGREAIGEWLGPEWAPEIDADWIAERARALLRENSQAVQKAGKASLQAAGSTLGFLGGLVGNVVAFLGVLFLIPLYTYFLLFELDRIHAFCRHLLPVRDRARLAGIAEQIGDVISHFFRGRLGVCFLKGAFLTLGLWITGIPYAFLFGMTSGFLSLIPFIGPFLGWVGAALVGGLEHGVVSTLLRTGIVFGLGELIEGYVLIPKILGDRLGLHEVVVIFALLAGGAAFGMLGVLLALPVAASLLIVFRELVLPAMERSARESG